MKLLPFNNLGIMMLAWQRADDPDFLRQLDEVSMAVKTPREVREGTVKLCRRVLKLWKQLREYKSLAWYQEEVKEGRCIGDHSIAVGLYAREIGLEQELAGAVYVYNLITSIVTNAVKTVEPDSRPADSESGAGAGGGMCGKSKRSGKRGFRGWWNPDGYSGHESRDLVFKAVYELRNGGIEYELCKNRSRWSGWFRQNSVDRETDQDHVKRIQYLCHNQ